jgi:CheY-like chemotaxis protein
MSLSRVVSRTFTTRRRLSRGYAEVVAANTVPAFWSPHVMAEHDAVGAVQSLPREAPLIYVVDDLPCLTELYTLVLQASGYVVKAFNDRGAALRFLNAAGKKPDLLITDYQGFSLPVEKFMRECLQAHPALRILMASGFSEENVFFSEATPTAFIQKPFTPQALRERVRILLE